MVYRIMIPIIIIVSAGVSDRLTAVGLVAAAGSVAHH
jgi:hypothetical protein